MEPSDQVEDVQIAPAVERVDRGAPRFPRRVSIQVALRFQGEDYTYNVNTVNVSRTGLRVLAKLPLHPGQPVLTLPNNANIPSGYCRVIWNNGHEAGLQYVN
jgi:hypothetical protein